MQLTWSRFRAKVLVRYKTFEVYWLIGRIVDNALYKPTYMYLHTYNTARYVTLRYAT